MQETARLTRSGQIRRDGRCVATTTSFRRRSSRGTRDLRMNWGLALFDTEVIDRVLPGAESSTLQHPVATYLEIPVAAEMFRGQLWSRWLVNFVSCLQFFRRASSGTYTVWNSWVIFTNPLPLQSTTSRLFYRSYTPGQLVSIASDINHLGSEM